MEECDRKIEGKKEMDRVVGLLAKHGVRGPVRRVGWEVRGKERNSLVMKLGRGKHPSI